MRPFLCKAAAIKATMAASVTLREFPCPTAAMAHLTTVFRRFLAKNCSAMSEEAKCYMGSVGVTQNIYTTCFSTNPAKMSTADALQATLYKGFFNRLKDVPYEAVKQ